MKNIRAAFAAAMAALALLTGSLRATAEEPALPDRGLAGTYKLGGVREVYAAMKLSPDGRFYYEMSYGAVDAQAAGTWSITGGLVTLVSDEPPPPSFKLGKLGDSLIGGYGEEPGKPVVLVVEVSTPQLGMKWSDVPVTAEFSNGKTRSGVTGKTGLLGFLKQDDGDWQGAVVKRVGVGLPSFDVKTVWFDVGPATTKTVFIQLEPGSIIPPAFERLELQAEGKGALTTLEQITPGPRGRRNGWKFSKQS